MSLGSIHCLSRRLFDSLLRRGVGGMSLVCKGGRGICIGVGLSRVTVHGRLHAAHETIRNDNLWAGGHPVSVEVIVLILILLLHH